MALLEVRDLQVRYEPKRHAAVDAVADVSFAIEPGEFVGLIGESGSGKTTLGMALLRLLEKPGRISGGTIRFDGTDITTMDQDELRSYRWTDIATVFQSSMNSLNPVVRVGASVPRRDRVPHRDARRRGAGTGSRRCSTWCFIDHKFITAYPHQLSGGMKQRINLALALAIEPRFVLLDEPTTGLDVVVQHDILENVRKLQTELGFAVLFISHDIGTVLDLSDRILVMYAGKIVEEQEAELLLHDPMHPYTKGLLGSHGDPRDETVRITYVPGRPPDLSRRPVGCSFAPRCPEKIDRCLTIEPPLEEVGGGRVACHVAKIQRSDEGADGADEVGPITRAFIGPQFVKSASESEVALHREAAADRRRRLQDLRPAPRDEGHPYRGGRECQLRAAPRRRDRPRGTERQREVDLGQDDHRSRPADLRHDHLSQLARRPRRRRDARTAAAQLPQPRADGLPGPVLLAEPGQDARLHPRAGRWSTTRASAGQRSGRR